MQLLISKTASSVLEIILFLLIPFVWWLVSGRKREGFLRWLGLKKIAKENRRAAAVWSLIVFAAFAALAVGILFVLRGAPTAASEFSGMGAAVLPAILVYAVFNTALPEELFFRGFLLKRMSTKLGFAAANTVQALLFGALHGVMFFGSIGAVKAILITAFTAVIAWFIGFVNEKKANGSVLPGWCIHAASNILSGVIAAFALI